MVVIRSFFIPSHELYPYSVPIFKEKKRSQFYYHPHWTAVVLFVVSQILHVLSWRRTGPASAMKAAEHPLAPTVATIKLFVIVKQLIHYLMDLDSLKHNKTSTITSSEHHTLSCLLRDMGFDGHANSVTNISTIFHPVELYWILLLQSNSNFLIHSLNFSSMNNLTEESHSSILILG